MRCESESESVVVGVVATVVVSLLFLSTEVVFA